MKLISTFFRFCFSCWYNRMLTECETVRLAADKSAGCPCSQHLGYQAYEWPSNTPIGCRITSVGTVLQSVGTFGCHAKSFIHAKVFFLCFVFSPQWQTTASTPDVSNTNKRMQEQSNWAPVTIEWEEQSISIHMHILHRSISRKLVDILTCRQVANMWEINADVSQMCFMRTRGLYCGRMSCPWEPAYTYSMCAICSWIPCFMQNNIQLVADCTVLICEIIYAVIRNTTQNKFLRNLRFSQRRW